MGEEVRVWIVLVNEAARGDAQRRESRGTLKRFHPKAHWLTLMTLIACLMGYGRASVSPTNETALTLHARPPPSRDPRHGGDESRPREGPPRVDRLASLGAVTPRDLVAQANEGVIELRAALTSESSPLAAYYREWADSLKPLRLDEVADDLLSKQLRLGDALISQ